MTEDSARLPSASAVGADHVHPDHLRKEGLVTWPLEAPNAARSVRCCSCRAETRAGGSLGVSSGLICLINR